MLYGGGGLGDYLELPVRNHSLSTPFLSLVVSMSFHLIILVIFSYPFSCIPHALSMEYP